MHELSPEYIDQIALAAGVDHQQAARVLAAHQQLASQPAAKPVPAGPRQGFDAAQIAFYVGALIVIASMTILLGVQWASLGDGGVLVVSVLYGAGLLAAAIVLDRRGWDTPAGLLTVCAVCTVPLITYSAEHLLGLWPARHSPGRYDEYYDYISGGWTVIEAATIIATGAALRWRAFPLLAVPAAFSVFFLSMDLAELLFGNQAADGQRGIVAVLCGLVLISGGWALDLRDRRPMAFWLHFWGIWPLVGGIAATAGDVSWTWTTALSVLGLLCALILQRKVYLVAAGLGLLTAGYDLSENVFETALLFPFVLAAVGVGVMYVGMVLRRRGPDLRRRLLAALPRALARLIPVT